MNWMNGRGQEPIRGEFVGHVNRDPIRVNLSQEVEEPTAGRQENCEQNVSGKTNVRTNVYFTFKSILLLILETEFRNFYKQENITL